MSGKSGHFQKPPLDLGLHARLDVGRLAPFSARSASASACFRR